LPQQPCDERGIYYGFTCTNAYKHIRQATPIGRLEQVPLGPRPQGGEEVALRGGHREHDEFGARKTRSDFPGCRQTATRQFHIEHADIGTIAHGCRHSAGSIIGLRADLKTSVVPDNAAQGCARGRVPISY
jgi:hypothetical protein